MTSLFDSDYISSAWPSLARLFGQSCSYYRESAGVTVTGYPKTITYVPSPERNVTQGASHRKGQDGAYQRAMQMVKVSSSDITEPLVNEDYMVIGSDKWTVTQRVDDAGGVWTLEVTKIDGYRKQGKTRIDR